MVIVEENYLKQINQIIQESGFDRLTKGGLKDSVRNYVRTLASITKTNPKKIFYTCMKKL